MKRPGFILPFTVMLIAVAMVIIMSIYRRGSIFVPLISTMTARQQAKQLALSGIQIAMSDLSMGAAQKDKPPSQEDDDKALLESLLPTLNRWQQFTLTKQKDGIEGEIKIALSCEQGKIDLNEIYDFKKKKFKPEWQKPIKLIFDNVKKIMGIESKLLEPFEKLLKERQYRFNDATELLTLDQFRVFAGKEFYEPPQKDKNVKRLLYLTDLFTVFGATDKIQPWLLSDSVRGVLGIKRVVAKSKSSQAVAEWITKFKTEIDWGKNWNTILQPVYNIELQGLPNGVDSVFDQKFAPMMFSVVSYGMVGSVIQRAYAIIERIKQDGNQQTTYDCKIRKFYWI